MTAATLFLSLILSFGALTSPCVMAASLPASAKLIKSIAPSPISQPLLERQKKLLNSSTPSYRGSADDLIKNAVAVLSENSIGAGVILSDRSASALGIKKLKPEYGGFVVTNFHVVELEDEYAVAFAPARGANLENSIVVSPKILGVLPTKDLAILGVREVPGHINGADIASLDSVTVGADVEAVGHPSNELWSYTRGYVSQIREDYQWEYGDGLELQATLIQTQTPISPGNSGGPLYSSNGDVVGINSFGNPDAPGLNFAVSASEFSSLIETVVESELYSQVPQYWTRSEILDTGAALGLTYIEQAEQADGAMIIAFASVGENDADVFAVFEPGDEIPFFLADSGSGNSVDMVFSLDHQNPNAVFVVYFDSDGDEDYDYQGWDFDGDFAVDHLVQYIE